MNQDSGQSRTNIPPGIIVTGATIHSGATAGRAQQRQSVPLPRAFEQMGAPLDMTEQSRNYLIGLPALGTAQVARVLRVAIDAGTLPATRVRMIVAPDPEEGRDELVALVNVDLPPDEAMNRWEQMTDRIAAAQAMLDADTRDTMQRKFSIELHWLNE